MSVDSKAILIDTSIWIELFRRPNTSLRTEIDTLVGDDRARICGAVIAELLQGATTPKDIAAVEGLSQAIPILKAGEQIWTEAGKLGQRLRLKGVNVGLLDCYLAALALEHHCQIMSLDKHFTLISKHTDLKIFIPV